MTRLLVDTSVLIKWFHSEGESELREARAIRAAHLSGQVAAHILDLGVYEVGNVLVRSLGWSAQDVGDQLDDLFTICGAPLVTSPPWLREAAALATEHQLFFYDAAWAAAARSLDLTLVSSDAKLLEANLAEAPSDVVRRLRLTGR